MALSKNLSLNKRKEDCRLPSPLVVKKFDISEIKQHFFDSIKKNRRSDFDIQKNK